MTNQYLRLLTTLVPCIAFKASWTRRNPSRIFGIVEWRDTCFSASECLTELRKPVCLLPFDYEEALVQGQTKELRLYEERFIHLFEDVMENHEGVLAMALLSEEEEAILSSVPLCEVADYTRMAGEFGIFLTIKCVGRVELMDVDQDGQYMVAECIEIMDSGSPDLSQANLVADSIDKMVKKMSRIEEELSDRLEEQVKLGKLPDGIEFLNDSDNFCDDNDDDVPNRLERYQGAFENALESDSQGYMLSSSSQSKRSIQELTAISWAAFATEAVDDLDAQFRVQALDTDNLVERLKLGLFLLNEKRKLVENMLQQVRSDMDDSSE
jgi:hypothetical protein